MAQFESKEYEDSFNNTYISWFKDAVLKYATVPITSKDIADLHAFSISIGGWQGCTKDSPTVQEWYANKSCLLGGE